ncbi:MAG: hypothetical protein B0D91_07750 [Oceanospirillales bacterium LUC14_002_19_P2]|nr:MAG: hypothetical protein B0D91_07750 [Oceanospirillales bacterium LUC14_002_19_P2]
MSFRWLVPFLLLFQGSLAWGVTQDDVYAMKRHVFHIVSAFHIITLEAGDQPAIDRLDEKLADAEALLETLEVKEDSVIAEDMQTLKAFWPRFKEHALANDIQDNGYTNAYAIVDINKRRDDMIELLDAIETKVLALYEEEPLRIRLLQLSVEMEQLTMAYLLLSTMVGGAEGIYTGDNNVESTDAMAAAFGQRLRTLIEQARDSDTIGNESLEKGPFSRLADHFRASCLIFR